MTKIRYLLVALIAAGIGASARADSLNGQKVAQAPQATRAAGNVKCLSTDVSSLTMASDFSVFLQPACPDAVRGNALRKLWQLLPETSTTDTTY
jgi:Protein of unknown function (DUF3306)